MTNKSSVVVRSRINATFSEELLQLIAGICDTKRIDSSKKKMQFLQQLLKRYDIKFNLLGGATNRLAIFIDGYVMKFAMDRQGYKDNLMEYALSPELQPYVTKSYETNGYILIAEAVKTMSFEDFVLRKADITKILDVLATDYLLGDVGYIKKNFANWGIRDDGSSVILDYAYIHRATENLFTCPVCGDGILTYDDSYSYLRCSNRTVCTAKFTYNERKMVQGDKVDYDMIDEMKETSVTLGRGENAKEVVVTDSMFAIDDSATVIETVEQYVKYVKEERLMLQYDYKNGTQADAVDLLIDRLRATDPKEIDKIEDKLSLMAGPISEPDERFIEVIDDTEQSVIDDTENDSTPDSLSIKSSEGEIIDAEVVETHKEPEVVEPIVTEEPAEQKPHNAGTKPNYVNAYIHQEYDNNTSVDEEDDIPEADGTLDTLIEIARRNRKKMEARQAQENYVEPEEPQVAMPEDSQSDLDNLIDRIMAKRYGTDIKQSPFGNHIHETHYTTTKMNNVRRK